MFAGTWSGDLPRAVSLMTNTGGTNVSAATNELAGNIPSYVSNQRGITNLGYISCPGAITVRTPKNFFMETTNEVEFYISGSGFFYTEVQGPGTSQTRMEQDSRYVSLGTGAGGQVNRITLWTNGTLQLIGQVASNGMLTNLAFGRSYFKGVNYSENGLYVSNQLRARCPLYLDGGLVAGVYTNNDEVWYLNNVHAPGATLDAGAVWAGYLYVGTSGQSVSDITDRIVSSSAYLPTTKAVADAFGSIDTNVDMNGKGFKNARYFSNDSGAVTVYADGGMRIHDNSGPMVLYSDNDMSLSAQGGRMNLWSGNGMTFTNDGGQLYLRSSSDMSMYADGGLYITNNGGSMIINGVAYPITIETDDPIIMRAGAYFALTNAGESFIQLNGDIHLQHDNGLYIYGGENHISNDTYFEGGAVVYGRTFYVTDFNSATGYEANGIGFGNFINMQGYGISNALPLPHTNALKYQGVTNTVSSTSPALINSTLSTVPGAGTFFVSFKCHQTVGNTGDLTTYAIYTNDVLVPDSAVVCGEAGAVNLDGAVSTFTIVRIPAGVRVEAWASSTGTSYVRKPSLAVWGR